MVACNMRPTYGSGGETETGRARFQAGVSPELGLLVNPTLGATRLALVAEVTRQLADQDDAQEDEPDDEHREDDVAALLGR